MPLFTPRSLTLALEASTTAGSVALWCDDLLLGKASVTLGVGQVDGLFPTIQHLLATHDRGPRELTSVVCGAGPGSFTSLRIAAALAKGLAHGTHAHLYAVPSLLVAAATAGLSAGRWLVHADALRQERYVMPVLVHESGGVEPAGPLARISVERLAADASPTARLAVLSSPLADEIHVVTPCISHIHVAGGAWRDGPVSAAEWEPEYGRLAEAQVKWEAMHGEQLPAVPLRAG